MKMKRPTRSSVGPNPSSTSTQTEVPVSGGSALITTLLVASRLSRLALSTKVGSSVLNATDGLPLIPDGGGVFCLKSPSIVLPVDVICFTLPSVTCCWKYV